MSTCLCLITHLTQVTNAMTISDSSAVLRLPRNTLSARAALRNERGIVAVIGSFPKMQQLAIRSYAGVIANPQIFFVDTYVR
jgi:hypothetical protein